MFPESHGFVAVKVTRSYNFVSLHELDRDKLEYASLKQLVTGIAIPLLSRDLLTPDALKQRAEQYLRPANCVFLEAPQVNK